MTRSPDDEEPGRRPPDYVIVVAASDWIADRYPASAASLTQALQPGQDRHRDPEPTWKPNHDPHYQRHHHRLATRART